MSQMEDELRLVKGSAPGTEEDRPFVARASRTLRDGSNLRSGRRRQAVGGGWMSTEYSTSSIRTQTEAHGISRIVILRSI